MAAIRKRPIVSIILATHNRRAVVENTLAQIDDCGLDRADYETIVVDNASTDGTADAVVHRVNRLVPLRKNAGSTAKAFGVDVARGTLLLFLDDDSFPRPGSLERMIEQFEGDSRLAAAGFTVHLPSGQLEGAALPGVFVGCGIGLRTDAYRSVGGLDRSFFMQAEEYDLAFRLAVAGWRVEVFDDLHVEHLKTEQARRNERTTYFDTRNNLRVTARYIPAAYARMYKEDCLQRYGWLARREGLSHLRAFGRGKSAGTVLGALERITYSGRRLSAEAFEQFFGWSKIRRGMFNLAQNGVKRVVLAGLGKNVYPFRRFAEEAGIDILSIADDRFEVPGRRYRGVPILPVAQAIAAHPDAVIVSDSSPVHAARTAALVMLKTRIPVHSWFSKPIKTEFHEGDVFGRRSRSDERKVDSLCVLPV